MSKPLQAITSEKLLKFLVLVIGCLFLCSCATSSTFHQSHPEKAAGFGGIRDLISRSEKSSHVILLHGMMQGKLTQKKTERTAFFENQLVVSLEKALIRNGLAKERDTFEDVSQKPVENGKTIVNTYNIAVSGGKNLYVHEIIYSLHFARPAPELRDFSQVYDKRDLSLYDQELNKHATWINGKAKDIMNWGMADPVMYLNPPIGEAIRNDIRTALAFISEKHSESSHSTTYICSSLGSKIFLDTLLEVVEEQKSLTMELAEEDLSNEQKSALKNKELEVNAVKSVLTAPKTIFFLANQLALLELGKPTLKPYLEYVKKNGEADSFDIVSFSQPSDALTYHVVPLLQHFDPDSETFLEAYDFEVKNAPRFLGLYTSLSNSHSDHKTNTFTMNILINGYEVKK